MSTVDIIILSWDRTDDTIAAIESATRQCGTDTQIYVVDQGTKSHDLKRLLEFCGGLDNVHVRQNTENSGVPGGRNQASAMGSGDYIVALDNDAVFSDDEVCARAAAIMDERPELGALAFRISVFDSPLDAPIVDRSSWAYGPMDPDVWADQTFYAKSFVGAGHLIRRTAFEEIGRYDDRLFFMHEETDLCDRMVNAGYRIEYRGDLGVRHKVSAEHRVHWKAGRYQMYLRNATYLMMKRAGFDFDVFSELMVQTVGGIRVGFGWGAIRGALGALKMLPAARRERQSNPFVKRTEVGAAYLADVAKTTGVEKRHPQPWDGSNKLYQLYCRLRWETDFTKDFKA